MSFEHDTLSEAEFAMKFNACSKCQKTLAMYAGLVQTFCVIIRKEALCMGDKSFFFAGGGTGGHLYPAIAVAQQIIEIEPSAKIHFFCSNRSIDTYILRQAGFEYTVLPAKGFSICVVPVPAHSGHAGSQ